MTYIKNEIVKDINFHIDIKGIETAHKLNSTLDPAASDFYKVVFSVSKLTVTSKLQNEFIW